MIIKEFRVLMPFTVDEYKIGQLYTVAHASQQETGGGQGIEVVTNEPFDEKSSTKPKDSMLAGKYTQGQYTQKIYHIENKVPRLMKAMFPTGALQIKEDAWNCFPYCRTELRNPDYMKENFIIKIETVHLNDKGNTENAHHLSEEHLKQREVEFIDIVNDPIEAKDYKDDQDPLKFVSKKGIIGPMTNDWKNGNTPFMCAYKLVTIEFKWWGLQQTMEGKIAKEERRLFQNFHRAMLCWLDFWHDMNMVDIRKLEEVTKSNLENQRANEPMRGCVEKK